MKISSILILFGFLNTSNSLLCQNLVPNGSFENYSECPDALGQLGSFCENWFCSRGTCDYYNGCKTSWGVSVPNNVLGWQYPLTGNAYAGFVGLALPNDPQYREQMTSELLEPLIIGQKYYFSMYVSSTFKSGESNDKACNGQGMNFATQFHSSIYDDIPQDNPSPVLNEPHILNTEIIADSINWVQIKGSIVADSAYNHIVIGGFLDFNQLEYINVTGDNKLTGQAYYYLDEIRLSTDSIYAYEEIMPNTIEQIEPDTKIDIKTLEDYISIESMELINTVSIIDLSGKLLFNQTEIYSNQFIIDEEIVNGIYIISIYLKNGSLLHKKVKIFDP